MSEKILNPLSSMVSIGKSSVLFNIDEASRHPTIVVCESWGSALATGSAAVGINGKNMSNTQMEKLFRTPAKRYLVLLDHGAEPEAWKLAARLSTRQETLLAFLPYEDPNSVPHSVLLQSIKDALPYNQLNHLRYSAEHMQVG